MSDAITFALPEELSINTVAEWHPVLCELASSPNPIEIQSQDVCRIDTAGIQLLVAFTRQLNDSGKAFQWGPVTATLRQQAEILGLDEQLFGAHKVNGE